MPISFTLIAQHTTTTTGRKGASVLACLVQVRISYISTVFPWQNVPQTKTEGKEADTFHWTSGKVHDATFFTNSRSLRGIPGFQKIIMSSSKECDLRAKVGVTDQRYSS